ncbi:MAG: type II toxin-antitoxin system RelE/ParE family toxin [Phycisphaerales bacterium]
MWGVGTTEEFDDWFRTLPSEEQVEVIAKVELLKLFGPRLGRPHVDTLSGSRHANMKELRADTRACTLRIAFAFDPDRAAILCCAGDKRGVSQRRFYRTLIARADALLDAHIAGRRQERGADPDPATSPRRRPRPRSRRST